MNVYLIRDASDWDVIYGVIKLESEEQWYKAKEYVEKCRDEDDRNLSDYELIEEYFQENNIDYEWIAFDDELTL